jgi:hypothetical protein
MWFAQVSSTLKGAECWGYISPSAKPPSKFLPAATPSPTDDQLVAKSSDPTPNPEYGKWIAKDQQVLSYLFSSLWKDVFAQVLSAMTAADLWATIQGLHASQSRAHVIATRMASKGASTVPKYYTKMKGLADEMASAGRKLDDEELVSYILTGLDIDYESVITAIAAHIEPITVPELYAQLVAHEQRVALRGATPPSSANMVAKKAGEVVLPTICADEVDVADLDVAPRVAAAEAVAVAAISKKASFAKCAAKKGTCLPLLQEVRPQLHRPSSEDCGSGNLFFLRCRY